MSLLRSRERLIVLAALVATIGSSACVKPGDPGVEVAKLKADIVFGIKEAAPVAPANVATTSFVEQVFDEPEVAEKILEIPDVTPLPRTPIASAPISDCPAAALTAFPAKTAEVTVQGVPAEGVYKFKRKVTLTPADGEPRSVTGYEQRVVRRVAQTEGKPYEFSYEVVQPDALDPSVFKVTSFRVNSNPTLVQTVEVEPQTIGVVPAPGVERRITPPTDAPGMFVESISSQDAEGAGLESYEPAQPLKYMGLDEGIVRPGETVDTIGIDARTASAIRHEATVVRKTRVDACGEIVEGWLVEATQTFSDGLAQAKYFYNVATQYGSLIIAESIELTSDQGIVTIETSLADLEPQPLPEALK